LKRTDIRCGIPDMAHVTRARTALTLLAILVVCRAFCAGQTARYFKAECGTSAGYIKLGSDGEYFVIWREHMGVFLQEKGQWNQNGPVIAFSPTEPKKAPYEGTENTYQGKTFISWTSDVAAGIVVPVESTKHELGENPKGLPPYVFFKTTARMYQTETKMTYPFRYLSKQP
jgi:hypothetical protein